MKKFFAMLMAACVLTCALSACGGKDDDASAAEATPAPDEGTVVEQTDLTEFPEECTLTDDQLKNVATAYGDYISEALKADGYVVSARFEDDGSVHFDGVRTNEDGTTDSITDLDVFESLRDCFAYLYNCGQVDLEGNLLVSVSEGVQEQVEEAGDEAEVLAEEALDGTAEDGEAADGEAEDGAEEPSEGTVLVDETETEAGADADAAAADAEGAGE